MKTNESSFVSSPHMENHQSMRWNAGESLIPPLSDTYHTKDHAAPQKYHSYLSVKN